jgi:hypothetical protein
MIASKIVTIRSMCALMIGQFLLRGGDDQLVHGPCLDQHHLVVVVNSGQELAEFLCGRRVSARDRGSDVGNLVHNTPADGLVDRIPGGKETVDVGRAHAELSGDVGYRGPMVIHAAKLLIRCFQDPPAGLVGIFSRSDRTVHRIDGALLGSQCWS